MKKKINHFLIDITAKDLLKPKPIIALNEEYTKKDLKRFLVCQKSELELIFENKAVLLFQKHDGMSAIHYACLNPRLDVLEYTIELYQKHNLDLNVPTETDKDVQSGITFLKGETSLDFAIGQDSIEKFNLLIEAGANKILNKSGTHQIKINRSENFTYSSFVRNIKYIMNHKSHSLAEKLRNLYTIDTHTIFTTLFLKKAHKIFNSISMSDEASKQFMEDIQNYAKKETAQFLTKEEKDSFNSRFDDFLLEKVQVFSKFDYKNHPQLIENFFNVFNSYFEEKKNQYYSGHTLSKILIEFFNINKPNIESDENLIKSTIEFLKPFNNTKLKSLQYEKKEELEQIKVIEENLSLGLLLNQNESTTPKKKMKI